MKTALIVLALLLPLGGIHAQSGAGHEEHHPASAAAPASPPPAPRVSRAPKKTRDLGMSGMMMTTIPTLDAYPSLMSYPRLSPEERVRLERESEARMLEGTSLMSGAMNRVIKAARRGDHVVMYGALGDLRVGVARLEAGLAGKTALDTASGQADIALTWLRSEMHLSGPTPPVGGIGALSPFHVTMMLILAGFALTVLVVHVAKMRRIEAMAAQWSSASAPKPAGVRNP